LERVERPRYAKERFRGSPGPGPAVSPFIEAYERATAPAALAAWLQITLDPFDTNRPGVELAL